MIRFVLEKQGHYWESHATKENPKWTPDIYCAKHFDMHIPVLDKV